MDLFAPNLARLEAQRDSAGLVAALQNSRPDIRAQAILALARLKAVEAVPMLIYLRNDPNIEVAVNAGIALAELSKIYPLYPHFDLLIGVATDLRVPAGAREQALQACMAMDVLRTEVALSHVLQWHQQALANVQNGDLTTREIHQPAINLIQTNLQTTAEEKTRREVAWIQSADWFDIGRWLAGTVARQTLTPALIDAAFTRTDVLLGDPLLMLQIMRMASPMQLATWLQTLQARPDCAAIALIDGLTIDDESLRELAYQALAQYPFPACRQLFAVRAADRSLTVAIRAGAVLGLALVDPAAAAEPLLTLITEGEITPLLLSAASRIDDPRLRSALILAWEQKRASIPAAEQGLWLPILATYGYGGIVPEYIAWLLRESSALRDEQRRQAISFLQSTEQGRKALPQMLGSVMLRPFAADALLAMGEAGQQIVLSYLRQAPEDEAQRIGLWLAGQPIWWQMDEVRLGILGLPGMVESLMKTSRDPEPVARAWLLQLTLHNEPLVPAPQTLNLDEATKAILEITRRHPSRAYLQHTLNFTPDHFVEVRTSDRTRTEEYIWRSAPESYARGSVIRDEPETAL